MILTDNETKVDLLNNEAIAATIIKLLRDRPDHPTLQTSLLDFLESLPPQELGPWACSGWEGGLKETEAVQRFDHLLEVWGCARSAG